MDSVLMIAAEHGGLPGGKVGGIGDVLAQLPTALVAAGTPVDVLLPSYGVYQDAADAQPIAEISLEFAGSDQTLVLLKLPAISGAGCWIIHHPLFGSSPGQIYHHDPADAPFATDANIYALFCAAAIEFLAAGLLPKPEVVHLHDWHTGTFAALCRATPALASMHLVFTIHNLALQGVRPLAGHPSSLASWFPGHALLTNKMLQVAICDPRYADCYNPMRAGINLADKVHVVSPGYAGEVMLPNDERIGLHGGEGLERDLQRRAQQSDLVGILNGCDYEEGVRATSHDAARAQLPATIRAALNRLIAGNATLRSSDYVAGKAFERLGGSLSGRFLLTSVGRLTDQKMGLLLAGDEQTLLDRMLKKLGERGALVLLGSGDQELEMQLVEHSLRHSNFLFLRGYSDSLAQALYAAGDLFLMPSLFEPCGISQLLAMRDGQPCLVHAVGGLRDTVCDSVDGFSFAGADIAAKLDGCEDALARALDCHQNTVHYRDMRAKAAANRFTWQATASACQEALYRPCAD